MTNLLEAPSFDPKSSPPHYFKLYETPQGLDTIWVFHPDFKWKNGEFCAGGPMRLDRYVEVKTFLKLGMPSSFYRNGFDYAINVNGKAVWLHFAYEGPDKREYGVFGRWPNEEEWKYKHLWVL